VVPQSAFLPAARAFLQRAFAIADSLALAAALIVRFGFVVVLAEVVPLILAHLALAPAAILARAAALILCFCGAGGAWFIGVTAPRI
jgi:hypothetical protein